MDNYVLNVRLFDQNNLLEYDLKGTQMRAQIYLHDIFPHTR